MGKNYIRVGIILLIVVAIGRLFGFVRETLIAASFGASGVTDAFFVAMSIPNIVFATISTTVGIIIVPTLTKISVKNEGLVNAYSSFICSALIGIVIFFSIIGAIASPLLIESMFRNLEYYQLAVLLTAIYFPSLVPMTISHFLSSYLQVKKVFVLPTITQLISNILVVLATIFFAQTFGIQAVVVGTITGITLQSIILYFFSKRYGFKLKMKAKFSEIQSYLKDDLKKISPIIFTSFVIQANLMMDRFLASYLGEGSISSLSFAFKINEFVTSIIITALGAILYPNFAELHQKNEIDKLKTLTFGSIKMILLIAIPLVLGFMEYSQSIVKVLFGYGEFNTDDIHSTAACLFYYAVSIPFLIITSVLSRYFYAVEDVKAVLLNSVYYTLLNIVLSLTLVNYLDALGIAIAFSLSSCIGCIMLLFKLYQRVRLFSWKDFLIITGKISAAAALMIVIVHSFNNLIKIDQVLEMGVGGLIGVITYFSLLILFRVHDAKMVLGMVKLKNKKQKAVTNG